MNSSYKDKQQMNRNAGNAGFSLIELVIGLALISIMMPSTMVVFQQVLQNKYVGESRIMATHLALEVMENITQKRFADIQNVPLTSFGYSEGDDCEDTPPEDKETEPYCDENMKNFKYEIRVRDADPAALDTECASASCSPDYKRVEVEVQNDVTKSAVRLTTLVTNTR